MATRTRHAGNDCTTIGFLLFLRAACSLTSTTATAESPPWQTVFPDTQIVVPLFGKEGPEWRMFYSDTPSDDPSLGNFSARVPGDVVSDHMHNGMIQDPFIDMHLWEQANIWLGPQQEPAARSYDKPEPCQKKQTRIWKYSTEFDLENFADKDYAWRLIVESIQMGAAISWNGLFVANVTDQFLRYVLPITNEHLSASVGAKHILSVTFHPSMETDGRFMACAGGWDWAPYTLACDDQGRRIFTRGIIQPIYLVAVDQVVITHVVPKVYYQGSMPR
jgi:beta-mannosidase